MVVIRVFQIFDESKFYGTIVRKQSLYFFPVVSQIKFGNLILVVDDNFLGFLSFKCINTVFFCGFYPFFEDDGVVFDPINGYWNRNIGLVPDGKCDTVLGFGNI